MMRLPGQVGVLVAVLSVACSVVLDFDKTPLLPEGAPLICERPEDCATDQLCVELECVDGLCVLVDDTRDLDDDGYVSSGCGGDDCDDSTSSVNTAQVEGCNGMDDNCDGVIDEGLFDMSPDVEIVEGCGAPSLAGGGGEHGLVCETTHPTCASLCTECESCIVFARLSLEGYGYIDQLIPIAATLGTNTARPSIARTEGGFALGWVDRGRVYADVVDDGSSSGRGEVQVSGDDAQSTAVDVSSSSPGLAIAWAEERGDASSRIRVGFLDIGEAGAIEIAGEALTLGTGLPSSSPTVARFAGGVAVAWTEQDEGGSSVHATVVDAGGLLLSGPIIEGNARNPDLMSLGSTDLALVYSGVPEDQRATEVFFAGLSGTENALLLSTPMRLSSSPGGSDAPRIGALVGADELGVVWHDERSGERQVLLARLTRDGELIETELPLSAGPGRADFPSLSVREDHRYLVGWRSGTEEISQAALAEVGCPVDGDVSD